MLQSCRMPSHCCAFAYGITCSIFLPIFARKLLLIFPRPNSDGFSLLRHLHISSLIRGVNFYSTLNLAVTCYGHTIVLFYCSGSSGTKGPCPFHPCIVPSIMHTERQYEVIGHGYYSRKAWWWSSALSLMSGVANLSPTVHL